MTRTSGRWSNWAARSGASTAAPTWPDAVFIEDIAVVVREGAVIDKAGRRITARRDTSRGGSAGAVRLSHREIQEPGTLDGGDVLVVGRDVFVGASSRTNTAGINQIRRILGKLGYNVRTVPVQRCLHLKSAVTAVAPRTVLINRELGARPKRSPTSSSSTWMVTNHIAANALLVGDTVIYPAAFPRTRARLEQRGLRVKTVDVDELAKAEGG